MALSGRGDSGADRRADRRGGQDERADRGGGDPGEMIERLHVSVSLHLVWRFRPATIGGTSFLKQGTCQSPKMAEIREKSDLSGSITGLDFHQDMA
jgi:hypothetical protein